MRIVSLIPAATEFVAALGAASRLVAISHECDHPPEVARLPRATRSLLPDDLPAAEVDRRVRETLADAGTLYALDEELLRGLRPDVIVTQKLCDVCAVSHGTVARFAASLPDPPRVVSLDPVRLEDVLENVREVARALDVVEKGEAEVARLRDGFEAIRRRAAAPSRRPRCVVLEWVDPPWATGHWVPELVEIAGGVEALGRAGERSVPVSHEAISGAAPEVLVIAACGRTAERARDELPVLSSHPFWRDLPAVRAGRVYCVRADAYFSRPGPRLLESARILTGLLHPDLFPEPLPDGTVLAADGRM